MQLIETVNIVLQTNLPFLFRYGLMSTLVRQANCWFGSLMLFDHGVKFFLCCTMLYTALYNFQTDSLKSGVYMGNMLAFGIHTVSCNLLASQLYRASSSVRIKLASILNENWDSMDKASRYLQFHSA